jgi:hypothetical protein
VRSILPSLARFMTPMMLLCGISGGCAPGAATDARPDSGTAQVIDAPDHFIVGAIGSADAREPRAGEGCRNPMVDPRDGTALTLVRSDKGMGDYEVPEGRYGVGAKQLLRLDCATGRVVGIVKR